MANKYFDNRDSRGVYFTESRTNSAKDDAKARPAQTLGVGGNSPYSSSSARVVIKKYALKRG
jgi:hypothetical protein